jgi:hypothetical protein
MLFSLESQNVLSVTTYNIFRLLLTPPIKVTFQMKLNRLLLFNASDV